MVCPLCKAEVAIQQGFCPHCGSLIGPGFATQPPASSSKLWWIPLGIVAALLVSVVGAAIYLWHSGALRRFADSLGRPYSTGRTYKRIKVQHGGLLKPEQLHGHGKLYFVPIGLQVFPPEELAAHYKQKFNLDIAVLPGIPIDSSMPHSAANRYMAQGLIRSMQVAYPKLADDPEAVLIGLTDANLYVDADDSLPSYHGDLSGRIAVVSSRGYPSSSYGAEQTPALSRDFQHRQMLQMLTKYVALLHYGLQQNNDSESILRQPLEADGGRDDLYQSDLDPQATPAGRWGYRCAIIYFVYSYHAREFVNADDSISGCGASRAPATPDQQWIVVDILRRKVGLREMEFQLPSVPPIALQRTYISDFNYDRSFGFGSAHTYGVFLTTENPGVMDKVEIGEIDFDYHESVFQRTSAGTGFSPNIVFEGQDPLDRLLFRSKMTWHAPDFYIAAADGKFYSFLGCGAHSMCYWDGYRDAAGHELKFNRDGRQNLIELTPARGSALAFKYDSQKHIAEIRNSNGQIFRYQYDDAGNLTQVTRPDGIVTRYSYDPRHNLTSVTIAPRSAGTPKTIFSAEYNVKSKLATFQIGQRPEYVFNSRTIGNEEKITIAHAGYRTLVSREDCECGEYRIFKRAIAVAAKPVH